MRIIKIILFSLFGMIAVFAAILVFIFSTYNNQDYQHLLIKTVDNLSGYTLSITGSFILNRSFTPVLSASGIELHGKTDDSYIRIDKLRIQIALAPLLNRTLLINDLLLENMRVEMQTDDEIESPVNLLSYLPVPIIEHAVLKNIQLKFNQDDQTHSLDSLVIAAKDRQAPLEMHGTGKVMGREFSIQGQLGPLADMFAQHKLYPVKLVVDWQHAQLAVNGTIEDLAHGKGINLAGNFNIPEIDELFAPSTPFKGRVQGSFQVQGSFAEPVLTEIQTIMLNGQSVQLQVTGTIGNGPTREQTDLHLTGYIHDAELLKWILPERSPAFNDFSIEADIGKGDNEYNLQNITAKLSNGNQLIIVLTGDSQVVRDEQPFKAMDILADISSKNTATVNQFLGNILPEMGPVQGTVRISTQGKDFILSNIDLLAGVGQQTQLTAKGRVGPLSIEAYYDDSKIALDLALIAEHSAQLASLLDIEHPEIGPITIDAHLSGSARSLALEDIKLKAGYPGVLSFLGNGRMSWDQLDTDSPVQSIDIAVQANSPSIQDASRLYGGKVPDLGPAEASMRVHGKGKVLTGSDLKMRIGTENSLLFTAQGKAAQIFIDDLYYKGIQLTGTFNGESTSYLSALLENQKIPDFGSVKGKFTVKGDSITLRIPEISLAAGRSNKLMMRASGQIAQIPLRQQAPPSGFRIDLTAAAPSSADLSPFLETEIPDLGRLSIKGLLTDHNGMLAIEDLLLTTGNPQQPVVRISGTVEDLLSRNGLKMKILFDEKTLVKLFDLKAVPELGGVTGSALISDADGSLGIEELKLESRKSELIYLRINGAIDDIIKTDEISVNAEIAIKDPALFGKLFAIDLSGLRPIYASGRLRGNRTKATFKGNSKLGKTRFSSDLILSFINGKPDISGKISSPNLFLEDFGIIPEVSASKPPLHRKVAKPVNSPLFSHAPLSLQFLHKADLNLQLRVNRLTGTDYNLDKINIDLFLQNGMFKVMPAKFIFSGGRVLMKVEIDAKVKPEWSLNIIGKNVQLGEILGQKHRPPPIEGDLDVVVDLRGSGASEHEIAASLNGGVGIALEKGKILRRKLELIFLNPLGWLFSYGVTDNEIRISCGLARYQIKRGIVRSKVFFIDGPKLMIRGKEEINLALETINSLYNLEKKKFFVNTNVPILVRGNLADPDVEQAPLPSVLSKADRYIFAPVAAIPEELLGTLFEVFDSNKNVASPCNVHLEP